MEILDGVFPAGDFHDPGILFFLLDARDAAPAEDRALWDDAIDGFITEMVEGAFA